MAAAVVSQQQTDILVQQETPTKSLAQQLAQTNINVDNNNLTVVRGTIFRKRKYRDNVSLAIRKLLPGNEIQQQQQQQQQPPVLVMVPRSDPSMPLEGCFLGAIVEIGLAPQKNHKNKNDGDNDDPNNENGKKTKQQQQQQQNNHQTAISLRIIRCSPDPNAIQDCLLLVTERKLELDIFLSPNNGIALLKDIDQAKQILSLPPKDALRRAFVKRLSSGLEGKEVTTTEESMIIRPRKRQTHVKARQRTILEKLEASQKPMDPTFVKSQHMNAKSSTTTNNSDDAALTYNLPDPNDPTVMSGRHPKTRREYLHDKKWPQIRWLVKRLDPILQHIRQKKLEAQKYIEILDVGGGRGDLAVAVAEAFGDVRVTVVDLNEQSLEGGRAYYQSRKPSTETDDRVLFVCGDFADYARSSIRFDVVTAWHACGDLSDYALEFAIQKHKANANAFVICPCCYTKRYIESFEPKWIGDYYQQQQQQCMPCTNSTPNTVSSNDIRTVQKLAEINERPEITHRAMGLINTMRLRSLLKLSSQNQNQEGQQQTFDITLEEYDLSYSSKNLVLVGVKN